MTEEEYMSVVENNRLPNGLLFGLPVVYDTDRDDLKPGKGCVALASRVVRPRGVCFFVSWCGGRWCDVMDVLGGCNVM